MESFVFQKESRVFYISCFLGYLVCAGFILAGVSRSFETMSIMFNPILLLIYLILFVFFTYLAVKGILKASMSSIFTMFLSAFSLALLLYPLYRFLAE